MDEVMRDDITTRFLGFSNVHTPAAGHLLSIPFQHTACTPAFFSFHPRAAARIVLQ